MNPQPEEDLQRRLQKLEAEINSLSGEITQPEEKRQTSQSGFVSLNSQLTRLRTWFNGLSGTRKLVFLGVTVLLGFAILQAVLKLVASAISLALLAVLVYLGYKFFVSNSFQHKK
ncbi:MAG: hypothetical protein KME32_27815 [Mojavia pulchra JT2-VF2]|jgi:septal ring factor EnvC (AmiA/AmiB activator)|uniref:Uncharacterized protein n=1 Tax=Mojavia pulchra JT2-VF2 TaxID=287848 RepID=A0A951Q5C3_9NOST|nr:hypothetical protein [Mojavia pulchra JT2-VF2]